MNFYIFGVPFVAVTVTGRYCLIIIIVVKILLRQVCGDTCIGCSVSNVQESVAFEESGAKGMWFHFNGLLGDNRKMLKTCVKSNHSMAAVSL
jgi:hypothetical protein